MVVATCLPSSGLKRSIGIVGNTRNRYIRLNFSQVNFSQPVFGNKCFVYSFESEVSTDDFRKQVFRAFQSVFLMTVSIESI